jgi:hypothetical protein
MTTDSADDLRPLIRRCLTGTGSHASTRTLRLGFRTSPTARCGQRRDAENGAFVRVLKYHRWDAGLDFEPWLFAIAGNRCRTAFHAKALRPATGALPEQVSDGCLTCKPPKPGGGTGPRRNS